MNQVIKFSVFLFSLVALIAVTSCNTPKHPKEVITLDSLSVLVNQAGEQLTEIDVRKADSCYKVIQQQLRYIQQNYRDTMARSVAMFLSDYHSIKEPLEMIGKNYEELKKQVSYTGNQLKNLSHDLQHNLVEEEKVKTYVEAEVKEAGRLISTIVELSEEAAEQLPKFEQLQPRVTQMVDSLANSDKDKQIKEVKKR